MIIQVYEFWEYEGLLHARAITEGTLADKLRGYERTFDLAGKDAHFILCCNDHSLSRADAIYMAEKIHKRKVVCVSINVKEMSWETKPPLL